MVSSRRPPGWATAPRGGPAADRCRPRSRGARCLGRVAGRRRHAAAAGLEHADDRVGDLAAGPEGRRPDRSPARIEKLTSTPADRQPAHVEPRRGACGRRRRPAPARTTGRARRADHRVHELVLGRLGDRRRIDEPPVPQHGHGLAELEHLVEVVRDVEAADPARPQPGQVLEEPRDLAGLELCGRLVEDDEARAERSARAISTSCRWSTVSVEAGRRTSSSSPTGEQLARLAPCRPQPMTRGAAPVGVEDDVLGDAEGRITVDFW